MEMIQDDVNSACDYQINCLMHIARLLKQRKSSAMNDFLSVIHVIYELAIICSFLVAFYYIYRFRKMARSTLTGVNWFGLLSDLVSASKRLHEEAALRSMTIPTPIASPEIGHDTPAEYMRRDVCSNSSSITIYAYEPGQTNQNNDLRAECMPKSIAVPLSTSSQSFRSSNGIEIV